MTSPSAVPTVAPALIVRWRNYLDISGEPGPAELTWPAFFAELSATPPPSYIGDERHPGWSPVVCAPALRRDANVSALSALVLDYDAGTTIADALATWHGHYGVLHTTRKHADDGHRFRIVLPFSRLVTPAEHAALWAWANDRAAGKLDASTRNASRFWYLPGIREGAAFEAHELAGAPVNVDAILAEWAKPRPVAPPTPTTAPACPPEYPSGPVSLSDRIKRASRYLAKLPPAVSGQGGHDATWKAACIVLRGFDLPAAVALDMLASEFNPRCVPPWTRGELEHKVASAADARDFAPGYLLDAPLPKRVRPSAAATPRAHAPAPATAPPPSDAPPASEEHASAAPAPPGEPPQPPPPPNPPDEVIRNKAGRAINSYANLCTIVRKLFGVALSMNEMNLEPHLNAAPLVDTDVSRMRERVDRDFGLSAAPDNLRMAICQVADEHRFHPIRDYLRGLRWDGEQRIRRVAGLILGIDAPTALELRMLRCWFISAVARALSPGCKVDTALVLKGDQSRLKSTFFAVLGGAWFSDTRMDISNKDALLQLAASWIYEWSELENVTSAKDAGEVKAFCTSAVDTFRQPFGRAIVRNPRSSVVVGTTNKDQFLNDPTGSRRFWVLVVPRRIDVEQLRAWRDMLWAEAVAAYDSKETWWLSADEEVEREDAADAHVVEDALTARVASWLGSERATRLLERWSDGGPSAGGMTGFITTAEVLEIALELRPAQWDRSVQVRVGVVMARLGWTKVRPTLKRARVWAHKPPQSWFDAEKG